MQAARVPTKFDSLFFLRSNGLHVKTIIDVGVQKQTADLKKIFADKRHVLVEPISENYPEIRRNYEGLDYELIEAAASEHSGEAVLQVRSSNPASGVFTGSIIDKSGGHGAIPTVEERTVKRVSLDEVIDERSSPWPYLLKIDVDGTELDVLAGAKRVLANTSCVVIEAPVGKILERASALVGSGFQLWDIVDLNYYKSHLSHVDLIFLANWELKKGPLGLRNAGPFDPKQMKGYLHKAG